MKGNTKWFVYVIAILAIAFAILFVLLYPQLDRSTQQAISEIQTGTFIDDAQQDANSESINGGVPTAAPDSLVTGLRGVGETIHDTETMGEGSRDYTLNSVNVYDTISESPIPLSECVQSAW